MSPSEAVRVLMYSHDTYGLGHLSRTLRIARSIRNRFERASILVLTGSPVAPYLPLPPGGDLIKLPSVEKSGAESYRSRDLEVEFSQIRTMRRELIRSTAETFRPHLFLVDNVPLGLKGELVPTLEYLRAQQPETRVLLDLRDVLDEPASIRSAWVRDGVDEALLRFYDRIFVFGDASVFDAVAAYDLPADRTRHLGYLAPSGGGARHAGANGNGQMNGPVNNSVNGHVNGHDGGGHADHKILLTAGGGGDGFAFLEETLRGLSLLQRWLEAAGSPRGLHVEVVTGPLMDADERRVLAAHARSAGAHLAEFVTDLPKRMAAADVVVSMAGYNTCCELLSHARAALLLPRVAPRREQILRAEALAARGVWSVLAPEEASARAIAEAVSRLLQPDGPRIADAALPDLRGLERLNEELATLCPGLDGDGEIDPATGRGATRENEDAPPAAAERSFLMSATVALAAVGHVFHWPGTVFSTLLIGALACSGLAASPARAVDLRPDTFGGSLVLGRDANVLSSSEAEKRAFETGSPDAWFEVDRLEDWQARLEAWSRWKIRSFYETARLEVGYRRDDYAHLGILARDRFSVELKQKLPDRSTLDLSGTYEPQVYQRHRVDKDALPGEPRFRPEAYRVWAFQVAHTRPVPGGLAATIGVESERERATKWFRERERSRVEGFLGLERRLGRTVAIDLSYGLARATSRNRPDVGSDLGYREHVLGAEIDLEVPRWGGPWSLAFDAALKLREYTTGDTEDTSRFDRHDRTHTLAARLLWARGPIAPFLLYEKGARRIDLPAGANTDSDESEYEDSFVATGIAWKF